MWGKKYCDSNPNTPLKDVIGNFLEYIQFHKIPANVLMREVHPLGLVPYSIIMNALAYQVMQRIPFINQDMVTYDGSAATWLIFQLHRVQLPVLSIHVNLCSCLVYLIM
jgi:hypothetical protein